METSSSKRHENRGPEAPAKRSQHADATYSNITGRVWPPCCDMLGVVGSRLTIFKLEPTTPNMSQHIATRWPNAPNNVAICCVGMLRSFAWGLAIQYSACVALLIGGAGTELLVAVASSKHFFSFFITYSAKFSALKMSKIIIHDYFMKGYQFFETVRKCSLLILLPTFVFFFQIFSLSVEIDFFSLELSGFFMIFIAKYSYGLS